MNCRACNHPNHPARRYCGGCGSALGLPCARCGFLNDGPDKFCGGCGEQLKPEAVVLSIVQSQSDAQGIEAGPAGSLSKDELSELLRVRASKSNGEDVPSHVSQDDIDKLFLS